MNPQKKTAGTRNLKFAFFNFQFSIVRPRVMSSKPQSASTRPPLPPLTKGGRDVVRPTRASRRRQVGFQIRNLKSEIPNSRQGSVLIVVIGLLLLMMLIGFTFFTFT